MRFLHQQPCARRVFRCPAHWVDGRRRHPAAVPGTGGYLLAGKLLPRTLVAQGIKQRFAKPLRQGRVQDAGLRLLLLRATKPGRTPWLVCSLVPSPPDALKFGVQPASGRPCIRHPNGESCEGRRAPVGPAVADLLGHLGTENGHGGEVPPPVQLFQLGDLLAVASILRYSMTTQSNISHFPDPPTTSLRPPATRPLDRHRGTPHRSARQRDCLVGKVGNSTACQRRRRPWVTTAAGWARTAGSSLGSWS
jgi:hypothetical protein